jgi:CRISPR/Cas system type I-B associated protein Csh2 (Cas7 group RAMP superfamily)
MAFDKRREYLFLYSVKDANPNGDPLNENHPRYDGDTAQVVLEPAGFLYIYSVKTALLPL